MCGKFPSKEKRVKTIGNIKFGFVSNFNSDSETLLGYINLRDEGRARVRIEEATDEKNKPLNDGSAAVWLAFEDRPVAIEAGLFVFGELLRE